MFWRMSGPWTTKKGVSIPAGVAYVMTGIKPNTSFMPPETLDAAGEIQVRTI